jgi:hypothetical protein
MPGKHRSRVVEVEVGRRTAYFSGTGVAAVLDHLGIPRMRDPFSKRICCPIDRADDAIAYLEFRQNRVVNLVVGAS